MTDVRVYRLGASARLYQKKKGKHIADAAVATV
jgi:hypothetical protein